MLQQYVERLKLSAAIGFQGEVLSDQELTAVSATSKINPNVLLGIAASALQQWVDC